MIRPGKKCINRSCEKCNLNFDWDMTDQNTGLSSIKQKCVFLVLAEEIPRIRGSIDGVQQAANESRNRAMETKGRLEDLGEAIALSFDRVSNKLIGEK